MSKLSVGKMAKINNVTAQTLRLYDKIGLLKPEYIDESNGYRYYDIKQSARLDMIQHMKALGMCLDQIKEQLAKEDMTIVTSILKQQRDNIDRQIKDLTLRRQGIDKALENYQKYETSPKEGVILLEYIPERRIYKYECDVDLYDYKLETYEYILRQLKSHILLKQLPMIYFYNVGTITTENKTDLFIFVDNYFENKENIVTLGANTYLCVYCNDFYKEKDYANQLMEHAQDKGYKINETYICEVIAELPVFNNHERNLFFKLQVPVKI